MTDIKVKVVHMSDWNDRLMPYFFTALGILLAIALLGILKQWLAARRGDGVDSETASPFYDKVMRGIMGLIAVAMGVVIVTGIVDVTTSTARHWHDYMNPVVGANDQYVADKAEVKAAIAKDFKATPVKDGVIDGFFKDGVVYGKCSPVFNKAVNGVATIDHVECMGGKEGGDYGILKR